MNRQRGQIEALDQDLVKGLKQTQVLQIERGLKFKADWQGQLEPPKNTDEVARSILEELI